MANPVDKPELFCFKRPVFTGFSTLLVVVFLEILENVVQNHPYRDDQKAEISGAIL
jgi:hypothetical protein